MFLQSLYIITVVANGESRGYSGDGKKKTDFGMMFSISNPEYYYFSYTGYYEGQKKKKPMEV